MALHRLEKWIPGLRVARTYRREWFQSDLLAGVFVAAVALPIGIAYAQLAGFPPAVGIYSSILPPGAYTLFGSSRQLIVNPDAAACAIVAPTITPLAAGDAARYVDLSIVLTLLTGLFCIASGIAGLGVIADFLSRPILTGYLNGIALSIIAGQLGTLFGFEIASVGFFRTVAEATSRLNETHVATLAVGLALFILLRVLRYVTPKVPAPLVAAALGISAVYALALDQQGVAVVGAVPPGFPTPYLPPVNTPDLWPLVLGACGLVLVSLCSMMTTARGFAAKSGYAINPNQDMIALGEPIAFFKDIGAYENTLIMVISDNGANAEGGPSGSVNESKFFNNVPDDLQQNLAAIDDLGGPKYFNHYPFLHLRIVEFGHDRPG